MNVSYRVKELTVVLAEVENSVYRLANTIRKTQKRANALKIFQFHVLKKQLNLLVNLLKKKNVKNFQDKSYKNQKH